jgi:hypothetical protein
VEDQKLIMTGESRNGKDDYEHAVPRQRYRQIVACLCSLAAERSDFTSDAVTKKVGGPHYHIQVVLKFLKEKNLVVSERKGQYYFSPRFAADVSQAWPEAGES